MKHPYPQSGQQTKQELSPVPSHPLLSQEGERMLMLRQDLQGLTYQKMNSIVHLENLQQEQEYQKLQMDSLSSSLLQQQGNLPREGEVFRAAELITSYNIKMRRQMELSSRKGTLLSELRKRTSERKLLVEEWRVEVEGLKEEGLRQLQAGAATVEEALLRHGRRHNLVKVLTAFIQQMRQAVVSSWIGIHLSQLFKGQELTRLSDQLSLGLLKEKSKQEVMENLSLYLKEFYSPAVFRDVTQAIAQLTEAYEAARRVAPGLTGSDTVGQLRELDADVQRIQAQVMDITVDMQIVGEEVKLLKKGIGSSQERMEESIKEEASLICSQYWKGQGEEQASTYRYFHQQLLAKYRSFISCHLERTHLIDSLTNSIDSYSDMIDHCQQQIALLSSLSKDTYTPPQLSQQQPLPRACSKYVEQEEEKVLRESTLVNRPSQNTREQKGPPGKKEKERFIVQKSLSIGCVPCRNGLGEKRDYEARLTSKFLILQPMREEQLVVVSEKIEVGHVKGWDLNRKRGEVRVDYGGCSITLRFITQNHDLFCRRLKKLLDRKAPFDR